MLTKLTLNPEEMRRLNYERYHYPCPIVQKRLHAVYIKATTQLSNEMVALAVGSHRNKVSLWIKTYQSEGIESLMRTGYGTNEGELEQHSDIHLLFLPPYSPNLNIIERLWKFTKKKILYAEYYDSPHKFHTAIKSFFDNINQNNNSELKKLLTLKFQFFDENIAPFYAE